MFGESMYILKLEETQLYRVCIYHKNPLLVLEHQCNSSVAIKNEKKKL